MARSYGNHALILEDLVKIPYYMSNKSEDFDEDSCIIDGNIMIEIPTQKLEKILSNQLQILCIQCSINSSSKGATKTTAKSSLATISI